MSIKVNTLCICRIEFEAQGMDMKKPTQTKWSFWGWVLGGGQGNTGAQG